MLAFACSDDFSTFLMNRGRGGTTTAQGFTAPIASGASAAQWSDPSPGWRADIDWAGAAQTNYLPNGA